MANTTWNPSDKSTALTLSGGNLTAAANTANASGGVRTIANLTGFKMYFEITLNTISGNAYPGMATSTASVTASPGGTGTVVANASSGIIQINGSGVGINIGAFTAGQVVCVAVDLSSANLIWFRRTASGNWNNNVANNPATGVGGISVSALFAGANAYGYAAYQLVANGTSLTANFGDSAFSGVVPAGFNSGFPTVVPSGAQSRVMVMA